MNNLNQDGLKKVYLFKSADFQFAEIDLSDNTLLLGESGVGKTTIMRAILFFYTMNYDSSLLNINPETKKTFIQWYFKEYNSHIAYEYQKDGSRFLFIVSNIGKLHYTFVDISNSDLNATDLLLDGLEPVVLQKLNENIEKNSLPNYRTTQRDKYIQTFHLYNEKGIGQKRIKQESKTSFILFEDRASREEFAKTLSNIFATSKISSDSVKKTIVSLIDDTTTCIDLNEIKNSLSDYVIFKTQIRKFEKQIPKINKLKGILANYKEHKKQFKNNAQQINTLKNKSAIKILDIGSKIDKLENTEEELDKKYQPKINKCNEDVQKKSDEVVIKSNMIDELLKKRDEYQFKNIDDLVVEHKKKNFYKKSLLTQESKYKALTSDAEDIQNQYEQIFQKLEQSKDETILSIKRKALNDREELNTRKMETMKGETQLIYEQTNKLRIKKEELNSELSIKNRLFEKIKISQAKVENYPFNNENIERFSNEVLKYNEGFLTLETEIIKLDSEIKLIDKQIGDIATTLIESKEKFNTKISKEKNKLFEQQEEIKNRLDFDKENLYGYLNKNSIENRDKIVTFVKDEILFSDKNFDVEKVDNSSLLFGLNVEFLDANFLLDYDQSSLLNKLESIKIQFKKCNEDLRVQSKNLEVKASNETRKLNLKRTVLLKDRDEKLLQQTRYKDNKLISEASLEDAKELASQQKIEEANRLNKQYLNQEEGMKLLDSEIVLISTKIDKISETIKADLKVIIEELDGKLLLLKKSEEDFIKDINAKYKQDLQNSKSELHSVLEKKGVDKKLLLEISNKIEDYRDKLNAIDKNSSDVTVYLSEYAQKIKNIPKQKESLEKDKQSLSELKKALCKIEEEFTVEKNIIFEEITMLKKRKGSLDVFLTNYNKELTDKPIENDIKNALSLEEDVDIDHLINDEEFMNSAISDILRNYDDCKNSEKEIVYETLKCTRGLDKSNIFKLDIVDDYIEASDNVNIYLPIANSLVEYVDNDKISILKDESSQKFKNHLNSIQKYLALFDDAIMDIETKVQKLKNSVKKAVESFNVIDSIQIRNRDANNYILEKLKSVTDFYSENNENFLGSLFDIATNTEENQKAQDELGNRIEELVALLDSSREYLYLDEGFVLEFKIVENGNDLGWRQTLNDVGSNGTSTLVKTIINISILQMVNKNHQIINHCILDEIGTISTEYFKELKEYVNSSGFLFVNGMPIEDDILISMYPTVYVGQNHGSYSKMLLASKMVIDTKYENK